MVKRPRISLYLPYISPHLPYISLTSPLYLQAISRMVKRPAQLIHYNITKVRARVRVRVSSS